MIAEHLRISKKLRGESIVVTQVSNSALEEYLKSINIKTIYSNVGDVEVYKKIKENKLNFGGEESGHIIFADCSTTGDGIISALQILAILVESKKKLSKFANIFKLNPQARINIDFKNESPLDLVSVSKIINDISNHNPNMKIVVRKSGTEKLIRVLVEGKDKNQADRIVEQVVDAISL
jgi:phosphoglucosamine mutase